LAGLRDIKRRIGSVKKTQQITRAMRMVAAAKLKRAQDRITAARPYADRMKAALAEVALRQRGAEHPLLARRDPVRSVELVVVTSDRGLAGAFNANILKRAERWVVEREAQGQRVTLTVVGRKARDHFRRRRAEQIGASFVALGEVQYGHAVEIAGRIAERYAAAAIDETVIVYNEFKSALSQRVVEERLLPMLPERMLTASSSDAPSPFEIEPDEDGLLRVLVPRALEVEIHRALLESQAGEHGARMTAMESATRNTEEMIGSLTLRYNRARQAAITKELVEIITGAEAL
jgi:F-type H+-transporting ATPase subunit gamma